MITATKFAVSWVYEESGTSVRRILHSTSAVACIECARLLNHHPFVSQIEVLESDTGKSVDWKPKQQWLVLAEVRP